MFKGGNEGLYDDDMKSSFTFGRLLSEERGDHSVVFDATTVRAAQQP
jgi:hypothetical protein